MPVTTTPPPPDEQERRSPSRDGESSPADDAQREQDRQLETGEESPA